MKQTRILLATNYRNAALLSAVGGEAMALFLIATTYVTLTGIIAGALIIIGVIAALIAYDEQVTINQIKKERL